MRDRASTPGWRAPPAASARPCRGRRRSCRGGRPRGRRRSPACTCAATSAMCTHTRIRPESSRSALIASSKSRAVGGSIGERRQVAQVAAARAGLACRSAAARASRSTSGSKRRRSPRSSISPSRTSRATSGRPSRRMIFPCPARRPVGATSTRSPTLARPPLSTLIRRPRAKNGSAVRKRPRRSSTATTGAAPPRARSRARRGAATTSSASWSPSSRFVLGSSTAFTSGSIALAAEVAPVRREVLADGDVERAAVREPADLLEDALAERASRRPPRRGRGPAARR